jgi:hypothetical protein
MKIKMQAFLWGALAAVTIASLPSPVCAQAANASTPTLAGTWEGKLEGVRSVVLRITDSGNAVKGEVDFYILKKLDDGPPIEAGKMTEPMLNPHVQGSTLAFQIARVNHNANPADTTILNFTLEPTGEHTARLERTGGGEQALEVEMLRVE